MMQSIDELARVITQLEPADQQALLDKVAQLNVQKVRDDGAYSRFHVMQEAMNDEFFLTDLREVMEDLGNVLRDTTLA
jgi:hypothetical protein